MSEVSIYNTVADVSQMVAASGVELNLAVRWRHLYSPDILLSSRIFLEGVTRAKKFGSTVLVGLISGIRWRWFRNDILALSQIIDRRTFTESMEDVRRAPLMHHMRDQFGIEILGRTWWVKAVLDDDILLERSWEINTS